MTPAAATRPRSELAQLGDRITATLRQHFDTDREAERQVIALGEEVGEFLGAYRRWAGLARRTGPFADVCAELADVVITAYVAAAHLGIDLDAAVDAKTAVIFARPWKDPR